MYISLLLRFSVSSRTVILELDPGIHCYKRGDILNIDEETPYARLDPNLILNAIESIGYLCDGRYFALNSYENRVYQVGIEDKPPLIAKFYRPNRWSYDAILEEHQFALDLAAEEIPVVAPIVDSKGKTLHCYEDFLFAVFPRKGGRIIELDNLNHLQWMGRFIGRMHAYGKSRTFKHRLELNIDSYGHKPYEYLIQNNFIPIELQKNFCLILESLLEKIALRFQSVGSIHKIRLHGDCHASNILWYEDMPQIVDLDDCLMGPAIQDLWMFLSGDAKLQQLQIDTILTGYTDFNDFDYNELPLIEALRSLRMIHYNGWLAKRWKDPAFPLNFPWFNSIAYWQQQLENFQDQLILLET